MFGKYGRRRNRSGKRSARDGERGDSAAARGRLVRSSAFKRARALPSVATVAARQSAIRSNAARIAQLKRESYGPLQRQVTKSSQAVTVLADHPAFFQINNPQFGAEGPLLYRLDGSARHTVARFDLDESVGRFDAGGNDHRANGPKLFLKEVELMFKFTGFVDSTSVRVDVVRQKKIAHSNLWAISGTENFMPMNVTGFKRLAGFTTNTIDTSMFEVLATRKLFLNSKGSSNVADLAQDRTTIEGTTPPQQLLTMKLPLNRVLKQIDSSLSEEGILHDDVGLDGDGHASGVGSYNYDNQHPLSNIWCLISTDDETAVASVITGDAVSVEIIRTCIWRDPIIGGEPDGLIGF